MGRAYVSNRGHDTIAAFAFDAASGRLAALGHAPSGGKTPRAFALHDGRLVVANQDSDTLCVFPLDPESGMPGAPAASVRVPSPTWVEFA